MAVATRSGILVPQIIAGAGEAAARRFLEFFAATIPNKNTHMAYYRAMDLFFAWCDRHKIGKLTAIEPLHVAAYIEGLQRTMAKPRVVPGELLAGQYPGARDPEEARQRLRRFLAVGVRHFIDLTEAGELEPYAELLTERSGL